MHRRLHASYRLATQQIQRQLLLVQYRQQANLLLSMNNYTSLVINWNDKSKQLASLKGLSHEIDLKNFDKKLHNLA
jgi:hypothetical protein